MGMTNFAQTMHNWQRMCKYFDEHYHEDCCHICPIHNCDAIWAMDEATDWGKIEEIVNTWAAEHPEPKYPTWREYLKKIGLTTPKSVYFSDENGAGVKLEDGLTEKANQPIPTEIAAALELEPHYE